MKKTTVNLIIATFLAIVMVAQHDANACEPAKKQVVKKQIPVIKLSYSPFTQLLTI